MAAAYFFREFQENQQRTLDRAVEAYQAYLEALQASRPLKGGMHWKKVKGREYLYKYRDRYGHGSSLGPRSPHTERLWAEFGRQRREMAALPGRPAPAVGRGGQVLPGGLDPPGPRTGHPDLATSDRRAISPARRSW